MNDINKKISQHISVDRTDKTTKIPVVQGSPLFNAVITPEDLAKSIAEYILINVEDDTTEADVILGLAKNYVDMRVKTDVPEGAVFTDTQYTLESLGAEEITKEEINILI